MKMARWIFFILFLPVSAWAMTPISDEELSTVTGQSGVNINPDVTMDINVGTLAWGDADGIRGPYNPWTTVASGGYIGINNFSISNLVVRARTDPDDHWNSYNTLMLKPITIDVATGTKLGVANTTFVRISPGALKLSTNQMQFDVALGQRPVSTGESPALDQKLGKVTLAPTQVFVNPQSSVDVFAHSKTGVAFDVNVTLDQMKIPYMSWGNSP